MIQSRDVTFWVSRVPHSSTTHSTLISPFVVLAKIWTIQYSGYTAPPRLFNRVISAGCEWWKGHMTNEIMTSNAVSVLNSTLKKRNQISECDICSDFHCCTVGRWHLSRSRRWCQIRFRGEAWISNIPRPTPRQFSETALVLWRSARICNVPDVKYWWVLLENSIFTINQLQIMLYVKWPNGRDTNTFFKNFRQRRSWPTDPPRTEADTVWFILIALVSSKDGPLSWKFSNW